MNIHPSLLAAAVGGLLAGAASGCSHDKQAAAPESAQTAATAGGESHACKGQNDCKGQGNCKTETHGCKGQNDCKGQGGCKTA